ncbi:TetR/AcrR family transcriptional regulator [Devosia sp.]|uniref:TetR/AcrR family transcriptional regulator n=1 Tax=Devosia sp. TaxID=1871048 RepID=UPI001B0307C3|nr:TetR/AcrR family transcriptional regulator [Devosia sp.]MBO9590382.1 TetR/AcrR family transcriptional regulator [Devosia sp.]
MARTRVDDKSSIIAESAARLFRDRGIAHVSIEEIAAAAGIAKGTFYLYFRTREDLVEKLATKLVDQMGRSAETAGRRPGNGLDRFAAAVCALKLVDRSEDYLVEALNRPENHVLHERVNVSLVRRIGPVLADIVEDGRKEGAFALDDPLSTIQFILAGQAALLGGGRFNWSGEEYAARLKATFILIERALGVREPGALTQRLSQALGQLDETSLPPGNMEQTK